MIRDCSECKHFDEFHTSRACHKCKPWLASTDCFSRADAIEVVHRHFTDALGDLPTETDEDGYVIYKDTKSVNELLKHNKAISKELKALPSVTKKLNNQIHLCDSCKYNYPNCPAENEDVLFGNGVGNDNICCCAKYLASADRPHGEWVIDTYNMELKCGICGETFRFDNVDEVLDYREYAKYCLACGARMGGDTK